MLAICGVTDCQQGGCPVNMPPCSPLWVTSAMNCSAIFNTSRTARTTGSVQLALSSAPLLVGGSRPLLTYSQHRHRHRHTVLSAHTTRALRSAQTKTKTQTQARTHTRTPSLGNKRFCRTVPSAGPLPSRSCR
jgi:hypothetical protein